MQLKMSFHLTTAMVTAMKQPCAPGRKTAGELPDSPEDYGVPVPRTEAEFVGNGLAGSLLIDRCLSRISVAAYLLRGGGPGDLDHLDVQGMRHGWLGWKTIPALAALEDPDAEPIPDETSELLPIELQRVLRLPAPLRQCFVLRVLMAMPRHYCAGLLRIDAPEVDRSCWLAARDLARMAGEAID